MAIAPKLRRFSIVVLIIALGGCAGEQPGSQVNAIDKRMSVIVDYSDHVILHPVPRFPSGRVDPVDARVGRHRDFGPEPAGETIFAVPYNTRKRRKPPVTKDGDRSSSDFETEKLLGDLHVWQSSLTDKALKYEALVKSTAKHKITRKSAAVDDVDDSEPTIGAESRNASDSSGVQARDGGYRLNFEDADVKDVLQAVLGNVLGLSYTVAPNVNGHVTIVSSAGQSREELLGTLETVLAMQGLSLTNTGPLYRVAPLSLGAGAFDTTGSAPGYGISVVPLRFSSVASINKLLSGFLIDGDGVRIDTSRNAIIVRGPGPRRAEIVRAIMSLDGDWMQSQSVSMFELKRSHPDELIQELTRIFANDKDGGSEGVIEFKPVKRLRSIMVMSKNPILIRRAGIWIRRLDHQDTSATSGIFVYRPKYRDARELTKLVNSLFGQTESPTSGAGLPQAGRETQNGSGDPQRPTTGGSSTALGGEPSGSSAPVSNDDNASKSPFGSLAGGNGLKGELADPVEAGEGRGRSSDRLSLSADTSNNTIVAYTDGETFAKVRSVLQQLDVPPLQVAVNVIIAEVQLNDELKYGVQFFLNQSAKSAGSFGFSTSPSNIASSAVQGAAAGVAQVLRPSSGFNFISGGSASPNVIISALDSISKVHILSTPSIVVMENKSATLEVGNQIPVTTQQAQSNISADAPTVNSVSYLDTGIILKIRPRVGNNGVVDMQIDQEISSVVPDATGSTTGSLTPTISKRRIASDISVKSGQNVLLAGLVTDTRSKTNGQLPFVGAQLGNLLGNTDNLSSRTELVMFLRPVIIRQGQDAAEVTEEFRHGLTSMDLHPSPVYKP